MTMTVPVKEAMVDALAMTITFPQCNIGITENSSNSVGQRFPRCERVMLLLVGHVDSRNK